MEFQRNKDLIKSCSSPRFLGTHLPFRILYEREAKFKNKMVYIIRNPKDVAVSYFYFYKSHTEINYKGSWDEFVVMFLQGSLLYGDWFSHVQGWWSQRAKPNLLIVTYEELQQDARKVIADIARFLGKHLSQDQMAAILSNSSFSSMKENISGDLNKMGIFRLPFMRKGITGDWKNHFTVAQNDHFDRVLKGKGLDEELLKKLLM
jgi:hypothetical protein